MKSTSHHIFLTLLLLSVPSSINTFSLSFLRREIRNWMFIFNTHIGGGELTKRTQVWNFKPYEGIARRQRFQDKYGFHGQKLVDSLSQGEDAVDNLIGYKRKPPSPPTKFHHNAPNRHYIRMKKPMYREVWTNHVR